MPANFYGLQGDRPPHQIIHEKSAAPDAKFHPKEEKKSPETANPNLVRRRSAGGEPLRSSRGVERESETEQAEGEENHLRKAARRSPRPLDWTPEPG